MENPVPDRACTVLVLGPLHPGVSNGLAGRFHVIEASVTQATTLSEQACAQIRAIACAGAVPRSVIDRLPNLEIIASFGVGYDGIDTAHAAQRGIVVTNTPDVLNDAVADAAVWLLLDAVRGFSTAQTWLRDGKWKAQVAYPLSAHSLKGRSIGIWGLGKIGRAIARRMEGFGLSISYCNRRPVADVAYRYRPSLLSLAESVDTLIAAVPGGPGTDGAVTEEVLTALGPTGIFINVGRGTTVDEDALIRCLKDRTIAAGGLDVFASEPDVRADLLALENVTALPHVAAATVEARAAVAQLVVDNLVGWFAHAKALTPVPLR